MRNRQEGGGWGLPAVNRRECINNQGAKGPAGPIPLLPSHTSYSYNYKVKKKQQGHKSPLQRSVAVYYYSVGKSYLSNTGK